MAKMKTFAVDVEITIRRTVIVNARKPGGAEAQLLTEDGWREITRYDDDELPYFRPDRDVKVVRIREV